MIMRRFTISVFALLLLAAVPAQAEIEIKLENKSDWAFHELYVSPVNTSDWGPDQLRDDTVETGERFTLHGVRPGKYDVRIVDEDGDECVVRNVTLKSNDYSVFTNDLLVGCQQATQAEA